MSSSEASWKARLQSVPHDELIGLLSKLLAQQSLGRRAADAVIARHSAAVPSLAQAMFFLSADLIDPLFETFRLEDCASSLVSTTWAEAWRRHLPLIATVKPGGVSRLPVRGPLNAIALSADTVLVSHAAHGHPESHGLSAVSTSWEPLPLSFAAAPGGGAFAKSQPSSMAFDEQNQWLFVADFTIGKQSLMKWLARPSDGVMAPLLRMPLAMNLAGGPVLCGNRLLVTKENAPRHHFASVKENAVVVLDTRDLSVRSSFGHVVRHPCGLCVLSDGTVVVGDHQMTDEYCLHFFDSSLDGTRLRVVACDFWLQGLYFAHDHLFGLEEDISGHDEAADEGECDPLSDHERGRWGRRVFVMSPDGELKQELLLPGAAEVASVVDLGPAGLFALDYGRAAMHSITVL